MKTSLYILLACFDSTALAEDAKEYLLRVNDSVKMEVFQEADLTTETLVSKSGTISFPLIGSVKLAGLSIAEARKIIADLLVEFRSKQSEMMGEFRKKFDENEQIITKIENMLKPY